MKFFLILLLFLVSCTSKEEKINQQINQLKAQVDSLWAESWKLTHEYESLKETNPDLSEKIEMKEFELKKDMMSLEDEIRALELKRYQ